MTATDLLNKVKGNLGITGSYQDTTIQGYIDEVKEFLMDGGVDESIVNSSVASGVISRGVADLWNYGSGGAKLSPYFKQRAIQLALKSVGETPEKISELEERVNKLESVHQNHTFLVID